MTYIAGKNQTGKNQTCKWYSLDSIIIVHLYFKLYTIDTTDTSDTSGFTDTTNCANYTYLQAAVENITTTQASILERLAKIEDFMKGSSNVAFLECF